MQKHILVPKVFKSNRDQKQQWALYLLSQSSHGNTYVNKKCVTWCIKYNGSPETLHLNHNILTEVEEVDVCAGVLEKVSPKLVLSGLVPCVFLLSFPKIYQIVVINSKGIGEPLENESTPKLSERPRNGGKLKSRWKKCNCPCQQKEVTS